MRLHTLLLVEMVVLASGCLARERDLLFPPAIAEAPGITDLGNIPVEVLTNRAEVNEAVIYHEVGPTGTIYPGGTTFEFTGSGTDVCVWMDPEYVSWTQSVSVQQPNAEFLLPDNPYDDGDLELLGGLSVYYTGTRGERVGGFEVDYEDSLGNVVPISLTECFIESAALGNDSATTRSFAGRGYPEYCTFPNTIPGISYTVLLETWATPVDDNRLSFGLLVFEGNCQDLGNEILRPEYNNDLDLTVTQTVFLAEECLIRGESIVPDAPSAGDLPEGFPQPAWKGYVDADEANGEVPTSPPSWPGSRDFEEVFCYTSSGDRPQTVSTLADYCRRENNQVRRGELTCSGPFPPSTDPEDNLDRCFCGDIADTPRAGAF